ncbi:hypothetical protein [Algoriphagus boritolerans]|uniref:hypothetical protein n=1 Tax=Algoriphagus boritolerans TaxID=308111 RepID=UPI000A98446F
MGVTGGATAADNLRSINPFDIDRVEVVTRMAPMLGDQGRNGIIAVYLKDNLDSGLDGLAGQPVEGICRGRISADRKFCSCRLRADL